MPGVAAPVGTLRPTRPIARHKVRGGCIAAGSGWLHLPFLPRTAADRAPAGPCGSTARGDCVRQRTQAPYWPPAAARSRPARTRSRTPPGGAEHPFHLEGPRRIQAHDTAGPWGISKAPRGCCLGRGHCGAGTYVLYPTTPLTLCRWWPPSGPLARHIGAERMGRPRRSALIRVEGRRGTCGAAHG